MPNSSSVIINRTPGKIDPRTITPGDASIPLDMIAWYDAAEITALADGDAVATWNDRSGHGYNATSTDQPVYKTAIQNGLPVVRFDAAFTQRLDIAVPIGSAASIFVVADHAPSGTSAYIVASNGTSSTPAIISSFTTTVIEYWNLNSFTDRYVLSGVDTGFHNYNVNDTDGGGVLSGYKDGSLSFGTFSTANISGRVWSYLGGDAAGGNYTGDIAEVIIYNRAVSSGERTAIEAYIQTKWGTP